MDFRDKYTNDIKEDKKVLVSNEAYLFAEMIDDLRKSIEGMRLAIKK